MSYIHQAPEFSIVEAAELAFSHFGIKGQLKQLPSERDQNFLVQTEEARNYVLKISNAIEELEFLDAQNKLWEKLAEAGIKSPQAVCSRDGNKIETVSNTNGSQHYIRMVTYLDGLPMGMIQEHTTGLYEELGGYLGRLNKSLVNFDHPAFHRNFHWDLQTAPQTINEYIHLVEDPTLRDLITHFTRDYVNSVNPIASHLRKSVIHNDANDHNLIITPINPRYNHEAKVVGLIDYGDAVYSYQIADLAVAIAYAVLNKPNPLEIAVRMIASFHNEYSLSETELSILFSMICLRLCLSLCLGAYQSQERPNDAYLRISQQSIQETLPLLAAIPKNFVFTYFKLVCGYLLVKRLEDIPKWLCAISGILPVIGEPFSQANCTAIDLGIASHLAQPQKANDQGHRLQYHVQAHITKEGKRFGICAANQPRLTYAFPPYANMDDITPITKTVHLGTDIFTKFPTPVYSPLAGRVHSVSGDITETAPTGQLILEHDIDVSNKFFTRYRNLESYPEPLKPGQWIQAGMQIGITGNSEEIPMNFQVITDLLGLGHDFPTHVSAKELEIWECFSPNPAFLLRLPDTLIPPQRPTKVNTLRNRKIHLGRNLSLGYRDHLKVERGWMQYLFDETGRKYLDAYNNVPHVGHCHPSVVQAGQEQMAVLNTNTRYLHDLINQYAVNILNTLPAPLSVCFFVNSGSEANELALRLARAYTQHKNLVVMESAYHGNSTTLIDISPYKHNGPGGFSPPKWVHTIPIPDLFRGRYRAADPQAVPKYLQHLREVLENIERQAGGLAGFIAETCPSVGGQILLPDNYLPEVYGLVRSAGGVCIADEVQTCYGRIGTHFYAFEAHQVVPDIVVLGKPIGNGHPIGAVITTQEIANAFDNGMEFFSTFGGNPVSCAIGISVLDVVQSEGLQEHALEVGQFLLEGFRKLQSVYPLIGDVRGSGLFLGVELVRDPVTLEPATQEADFIINKMRESGILLGTDGPDHNVLKIRPPMPFNLKNAQFLLDTFQRIFNIYFH